MPPCPAHRGFFWNAVTLLKQFELRISIFSDKNSLKTINKIEHNRKMGQ
jgi:hypothetical protein